MLEMKPPPHYTLQRMTGPYTMTCLLQFLPQIFAVHFHMLHMTLEEADLSHISKIFIISIKFSRTQVPYPSAKQSVGLPAAPLSTGLAQWSSVHNLLNCPQLQSAKIGTLICDWLIGRILIGARHTGLCKIARPLCEPPAILSSTPELGLTPLSCGMVGCWQINSILANVGHKNSIRILN